MPKAVKGFMSKDDQFFETEMEARLHELELEIRHECGALNVNPDRLFPVLEALADPIMEYLDVRAKVENSKLGKHQSNDGNTKDHPEALQSFEADGREPVSNMGRRSSAKAVRD